MQWEYKLITFRIKTFFENWEQRTEQTERVLNDLGDDGWEAVNYIVEGYPRPEHAHVLMKREKNRRVA